MAEMADSLVNTKCISASGCATLSSPEELQIDHIHSLNQHIQANVCAVSVDTMAR